MSEPMKAARTVKKAAKSVVTQAAEKALAGVSEMSAPSRGRS